MPYDFERDFVQPTLATCKAIEEAVEGAIEALSEVKCAACGADGYLPKEHAGYAGGAPLLCEACTKVAREIPTPDEISMLPMRPIPVEQRVRLLREMRNGKAFRAWQAGLVAYADDTPEGAKRACEQIAAIAKAAPTVQLSPEVLAILAKKTADEVEFNRHMVEHQARTRPPPKPPIDVRPEARAEREAEKPWPGKVCVRCGRPVGHHGAGWCSSEGWGDGSDGCVPKEPLPMPKAACTICYKQTDRKRGMGLDRPAVFVCSDCNEVLDRPSKWWVKVIRWLMR